MKGKPWMKSGFETLLFTFIQFSCRTPSLDKRSSIKNSFRKKEHLLTIRRQFLLNCLVGRQQQQHICLKVHNVDNFVNSFQKHFAQRWRKSRPSTTSSSGTSPSTASWLSSGASSSSSPWARSTPSATWWHTWRHIWEPMARRTLPTKTSLWCSLLGVWPRVQWCPWPDSSFTSSERELLWVPGHFCSGKIVSQRFSANNRLRFCHIAKRGRTFLKYVKFLWPNTPQKIILSIIFTPQLKITML